MKILEPGHVYELNTLDGMPDEVETIRFVNRERGAMHAGTQTQEMLRALIDRTQHCDNCRRWSGNDEIIHHLRMALVLHEARALIRKAEKGVILPERIAVSDRDGHFELIEEGRSTHLSNDAITWQRKVKNEQSEGKPAYFSLRD